METLFVTPNCSHPSENFRSYSETLNSTDPTAAVSSALSFLSFDYKKEKIGTIIHSWYMLLTDNNQEELVQSHSVVTQDARGQC